MTDSDYLFYLFVGALVVFMAYLLYVLAESVLAFWRLREKKNPDYEVTIHWHGEWPHVHAWGWMDHAHILRSVCLRPECKDFETHDIHPRPR